MNKGFISRNNKRSDFKNKIIINQVDKINYLQKKISDLEIDNAKKDELINLIDVLNNDFLKSVNELKSKSNEYDKLIAELKQMINITNQTVFKGKWKLIRFLLK